MFWLLGIIVLGYFWYLWDSNKSKQKKIAYFENEFKKMDIYVNNAKKEAESIVEEAKSTVNN